MPHHIDPNSYNIQAIGMGKAFCRMGYNFDYVALTKNTPKEWTFCETDNGCKARCIEKNRIRFFRWGLNREICEKEFLASYDLVIVQEYYQVLSYIISKRHENVVLYSGPYWNMFMIPISSFFYDLICTRKLNRNVKKIVVKSDLAKQYLEKKGYTNISTIGVGLDVERFQSVEISEETKELVAFMKTNPCMLYIGNLNSNKNLPFLLKVFEAVHDKYPEFRLVLIGKSKQTFQMKLLGKKDESYAEEVFKKTPKEIKDNIVHIQRIDNPQLKYVFPEAKAFLLPSKNEIFGMVLLESMYLGAPVISSVNGGSLTLLKNPDCGQMIDGFNVDEWANAVGKYYESPDYSNRVKSNAHKLIESDFTWDAITSKLISLLDGRR